MIQGPVQCLGLKKYEEHSNAQMLLPCPANKQAGEAQYRTFSVNFGKVNVKVSSPPRLLYKGVSCTKGGGGGGGGGGSWGFGGGIWANGGPFSSDQPQQKRIAGSNTAVF